MPLLLVRHCESAMPDADALTAKGQSDAFRLAAPLKALGADAVYASPYQRAVATIAPLAASLGQQIRIDARLRERDSHMFDSLDEFYTHMRRCFSDADLKLDDEESIREVATRGLETLAAIARAGHALPAIACHGQIIAAMLGLSFDQWRALTMPGVFLIDWRGGAIASYREIPLSTLWRA